MLTLFFLSAIAAQESLSGLETEMRKLEGVIKEIVDEMDYLKKREERFSSTNGMSFIPCSFSFLLIMDIQNRRTHGYRASASTPSSRSLAWESGRSSICAHTSSANILSTERHLASTPCIQRYHISHTFSSQWIALESLAHWQTRAKS